MDSPIGLADAGNDPAPTDESADDGGEEEEADGEDNGFDPTFGLINTKPLSLDLPIEEPVTSGGDGPVGN
jgi:hypothetical protein